MLSKRNYRAQKGRSSGRHPSDAFPVEKDALAAALVRTAVLMQGDQQAELAFAHSTLAEKVAQITAEMG